MKVNIYVDKTLRNILNQCTTKLWYLNESWKKYADSFIPEDTWKLLMNNKTKKMEKRNLSLHTWIENKTIYAPYIEYWVKWKVYNYNKPKWVVFYRWVWVWAYAKTKNYLEKNAKKFITNIKV